MAVVRYVEVDGRRVEISDSDIHEETRCDACGEYAAAGQVAAVRVAAGIPGGNTAEGSGTAHIGCAARLAAELAERAISVLTT